LLFLWYIFTNLTLIPLLYASIFFMITTNSAVFTGQLHPYVQTMRQFQQTYLLNKAVLEVVSTDVPYIALAKQKEERQERFFRQAFILCFVFCFTE